MYTTIKQAAAYHGARLTRDAWLALSEEQRAAALVEATDLMDLYAAQCGGWKRDYTQATPAPLADVCAAIALTLTDEALRARINAQIGGVASTSIGSASESYTGAGKAVFAALTPLDEAVLRAFVRRTGSGVRIA